MGGIDRFFDSMTRVCGTIAAFWALLLAFVIGADIFARTVLNAPMIGVIELVANCIVSIVFLQLPYAIYRGAHLRTTVIYQNTPELVRRLIDFIAYSLGIMFFVGVAWGGWEDMIIGWEVDEREGEGSIKIPVAPVRTLIILFGIISAATYLIMLLHTVLGTRPGYIDREGESEAPL
jgi:TRAP-type C4-dicarboxylate transport system permease small subunit